MVARLVAIAIKPKRLQPMQLLSTAELSTAHGVVGDSRGKPGPRQVTLLSEAAWRATCGELAVELPWTVRRANLLVDDLALLYSRGSRILLGDAVLEITGETDPCARMEAAQTGLFQALARDWRGGVCCRVLKGGTITTGMDVELTRNPAPRNFSSI